MTGFGAGLAARLVGVKYATLDYWASSGLIVPSIVDARGKGTERIYSFADLVALRVVRELRDRGITIRSLRKVVDYLRRREGLDSPLNGTYLVTDGIDVYERVGDEITSLLRQPGQLCFFVLDLSQTVEELKKAVAA